MLEEVIKRHDCHLTHELDPDIKMFLTPSPVLGMYILPTLLTVGAIFEDAALRE